uniref:SSD domain-containing protein n=1 Tax=Anopheles coluzzii TaxID=1518534 RepID=A0A8W7PKU5_ANOCL
MGQSTKNFTVHGTHLREAYVHAAHRTGLELVLHTGERISGGRVQPVAVAQPRLRRLVRQYLDLVLFRKGFVYNTTTSTTIAATAAHVHCYAAGCWLVPSLVAHLVDLGINYLYEEDPEQRFNQEVKHCNEAYDGSYACSCVDCDESCPTSEPPQPKDPGFMVGDLNGVTFTVAVVVGGIGLACIVLALLFGGKEGSKQQLPDLPSFFGGFPSVNRALGRTFTRWGTFCARNPVLILAICSWIVGGLAFGIQYLIITTDPVELWAAPDSRARQEKDYFDSRFSPFYRTEQIFIKPTRQEFFIHPTAEGNQTFGPAYDREFLLEVFKLQTTIEQLGQAEGRGLEQICFAPMTQVGAQTVLSECTVQSVFGYFKNSLAEFNRTGTDLNGFVVNYLDKINGCTRNAYLPSCFGTYGGPIEPGVALFWMGPPVYFVVKAGLNYTDVQHQNLVCGGILCNDDSISTKLYQASLYPETTHIARPASSWLDDYIDWLAIQSCCKYNPTDGSFCASNIVFCPACPEEYDETGIRPTVPQFERYLEFFLSDLPDENCAKAGRAAYSRALNYLLDRDGRLNVQDSYFSTYHTTAVTSRQFYTALEQARLIAADIQQMLDERQAGVEIFPYSVFYVFYEQYLTIWSDALQSLGLSLAAVFVVTFLVTGLDLLSALVVILLVFLIVLNMMGLMWLWNITLNAISLVNLVMSVGIGVEFISHIVRTYRLAHGTRLERSAAAMIFYFRMYLCIVLVGAAHGLILLPVFLTYIGPPSPPPPPPPAETPRTAHTKQEEAKLDLSNTPSAANETETHAIGNEPAQHAPE